MKIKKVINVKFQKIIQKKKSECLNFKEEEKKERNQFKVSNHSQSKNLIIITQEVKNVKVKNLKVKNLKVKNQKVKKQKVKI